MKLSFRLEGWSEQDGTGVAYDSSTGFVLPNGAIRSPDASWVENMRLEALSDEEREKYLPLCPNFVVELLTPGESLGAAQKKIREYIENGARLGWLLVPVSKRVHRPGRPVEELADPEKLPGDPVLPGFVLDPRGIW